MTGNDRRIWKIPKGEKAVENRLFRQQSMDQVNSPEQIRDYLRVTSPKLWMLIAAVLVLLAGFLAYLSVAEKEITVPVRVKVENVQMDGREHAFVSFEIPTENRDNYRQGMVVRFNGVTGKIRYFVETEETTVVAVEPDNPRAKIAAGDFDAAVVIESSTPIEELLK
jgi:hypothetical protein